MTLKKKKTYTVLAALLSTTMVLGACGTASKGNNTNGGTTPTASPTANVSDAGEVNKEELKPVELIWHYPQAAMPADLQSVEDAVNVITKEKINATVKLKPQVFGDYTQKMNTIVASGEKADIIWTSNWNFDYIQNQAKGAFIPLDELIEQYAPEVKKSMPDFVWDATKINGEIYAIPNYQTVTNKEGFFIQKDFADKYSLDINSIKKLEDLEPFLKQVKDNEPGVTPLVADRRGKLSFAPHQFNVEIISSNVLAIDLNNPDQVINLYESANYEQYLDMISRWYNEGYINDDAAVLKSINDLFKTGTVAVDLHNVLKPGGESEKKNASGGKEFIAVPLTEPYVSTGTIITTMQAISRTSKDPERAMMFINLVNTDKELYNLLAYGIEGKHYTKVSDNVVKVNDDASYKGTDWALGNVFNGYLLEGKDPAIPEQTIKENESANASPINGFKFDTSTVSAEIANLTTVIDEYGPGLNTGTTDKSAKLAEFRDKLKKAGVDKVVEEAQKQLDEWNKTK